MRKRIGNAFRKAGDALGNVDDKVQGFIRNKVYGLPEDGSEIPNSKTPGVSIFKTLMGTMMHGSRPGNPGKTAYRVNDDAAGRAWVAGSRAVQAGALTGAGVGLANLASAMTQFGGPADQQTQATLMPYDYTDSDYAVADNVIEQLMSGQLTGSQLNQNVMAGMYTKPQQALIADSHDFSKDEPYPYGDQTIANAIFTR